MRVPGGLDTRRRGVAEGVRQVLRGGDEQDPRRQRVLGSMVQDPLAVRAEAAEGDTERDGDVRLGRGRIVFGVVRREGGAVGAIDGELGPGLGVAPGGGAGATKLDGGFARLFPLLEGAPKSREYWLTVNNTTGRESRHIAKTEVDRRIEALEHPSSRA